MMKKYFIIALFMVLQLLSKAQVNTFPTNGFVGLGTANPISQFSIRGGGTGLSIHPGTAPYYGILAFNREASNGQIIDPSGFAYQINNGGTDANLHFQVYNPFGTLISNDALVIGNNGNVGIGISEPDQKLTIKGGGIGFDHNSSDKKLYSPVDGVLEWMTHNSAGEHAFAISHQGIKQIYFNTNGTSYLNGGNVGIGTNDTKGYKLAVAGNMIAESVKVSLQGTWPDYVFAKDYQLPTLQETEKHIRDKGHLPGIPSAAEVKANGIDLGEMNARLVQKIEELTLHLIEQNKMFKAKIAEQHEKIELQNIKLEKQQNELDLIKRKI